MSVTCTLAFNYRTAELTNTTRNVIYVLLDGLTLLLQKSNNLKLIKIAKDGIRHCQLEHILCDKCRNSDDIKMYIKRKFIRYQCFISYFKLFSARSHGKHIRQKHIPELDVVFI